MKEFGYSRNECHLYEILVQNVKVSELAYAIMILPFSLLAGLTYIIQIISWLAVQILKKQYVGSSTLPI